MSNQKVNLLQLCKRTFYRYQIRQHKFLHSYLYHYWLKGPFWLILYLKADSLFQSSCMLQLEDDEISVRNKLDIHQSTIGMFLPKLGWKAFTLSNKSTSWNSLLQQCILIVTSDLISAQLSTKRKEQNQMKLLAFKYYFIDRKYPQEEKCSRFLFHSVYFFRFS